MGAGISCFTEKLHIPFGLSSAVANQVYIRSNGDNEFLFVTIQVCSLLTLLLALTIIRLGEEGGDTQIK